MLVILSDRRESKNPENACTGEGRASISNLRGLTSMQSR